MNHLPKGFTTEVVRAGDAVIVRCTGELDVATEDVLVDALADALDGPVMTRLYLDLHELDFSDTTVIRVLDFVWSRVCGTGIEVRLLEGAAVRRVREVFWAAG